MTRTECDMQVQIMCGRCNDTRKVGGKRSMSVSETRGRGGRETAPCSISSMFTSGACEY